MGTPRLRLRFAGFEGGAEELVRAVREGRIAPAAIPLLSLFDQALAQAEGWPLAARAAVAAELALLLLVRLGLAERLAGPEAEGARADALSALVDLEAALAALTERARARAEVLPVPPAPLPRDPRLAPVSPRVLARLAPPRRPRLPALRLPAFGLSEAWRRMRALLLASPRAPFDRLAPRRFVPRAVHLAALLEAARRGWVRIVQGELYGPLEVHLVTREPGAEIG